MFKKIICSLILTFFYVSCSGYYFSKKSNPLEIYGIYTLAIPMFLNKSIVPGVSAPLTREFITFFMKYSDLKISPTDSKDTNAVLVGIIESQSRVKEVYSNDSVNVTSGLLQESIKDRNPFLIPFRNIVNLDLRLILIRKPRLEELELVKSDLNKFLRADAKIIFNRVIKMQALVDKIYYDNIGLDSGGPVNFTKNHKALDDGIKRMAKETVVNFKQVILNAF